MDDKQQIQEEEYAFPYHYVSQYKPYFTQFYNDTWGINYVATIEFLIDFLKKEEFKSLVDLGCGDGRITSEINLQFSDKSISGFDYSETAIKLCKALNPGNINFVQSDITKKKVEKKFDIAILIEVFEHIPFDECESFVKAIAQRVLNDNGTLVLTVPHKNRKPDPKHYQHFDSELILKYFDPYFKIEKIIPFEKGGFEKKILDLLLTNRFFILNHIGLRKKIYRYYKSKLFFTDESRCNRLFVKLEKR